MPIKQRFANVIKRGALFSDGDPAIYRYKLWRRWNDNPPLVFIMLNPSTADVFVNDNTVERCERRAKALGYGAVYVGNAFAFRDTYPEGMRAAADPIGPLNDASLRSLMDMAKWTGGKVVVGWGNTHGKFMGRDKQVVAIAKEAGVSLYCLKYCKDGSPQHPLYVGYNEELKPWPRAWKVKWKKSPTSSAE